MTVPDRCPLCNCSCEKWTLDDIGEHFQEAHPALTYFADQASELSLSNFSQLAAYILENDPEELQALALLAR